MKKAFIFIFFVSTYAYAQQDAKIKVDGDGNKIDIGQDQLNSTSQKTDLDIKGDSNKTKVRQKITVKGDSTVETQKAPIGLHEIVENTNSLVTLLISIGSLIAAWRGIVFFRKRKRK